MFTDSHSAGHHFLTNNFSFLSACELYLYILYLICGFVPRWRGNFLERFNSETLCPLTVAVVVANQVEPRSQSSGPQTFALMLTYQLQCGTKSNPWLWFSQRKGNIGDCSADFHWDKLSHDYDGRKVPHFILKLLTNIRQKNKYEGIRN